MHAIYKYRPKQTAEKARRSLIDIKNQIRAPREEERETSIDRQIYETFGDDDDCGMCDEDLGE